MKYPLYLCSALLAVSGLSAPAFSADPPSNLATVTLKAAIKATCTLDTDTELELGEIPASAFAGAKVDDLLTEYMKTFKLTSNCHGTDKFTYTFTPSTAGKQGTKCMASDHDSMRFCLKASDQDLDFSSGSAKFVEDVKNKTTTVSVTPQVAALTAKAGNVSGTLTVTIAPS